MGEVLIDRYVAEHKAFSENGAAGSPPWLKQRRTQALDRFVELGFPKPRDEAWRFTNVTALVKQPFSLVGAASSDVSPGDIDRAALGRIGSNRVVLVNGRFREDLSSLGGVPDGVTAGSLREAIARGVLDVQDHLGKYTESAGNAFAALGTSFVSDGAVLCVPPGVDLGEPLVVMYLTTADADKCVIHPRNLFVVGAGASAVVVEQYLSIGHASSWTNAVTESVLGENARLDAYRIQLETEQAYHTATSQSYQQRDSSYALNTVVLGGALSRHDINAVLDGPGAECTLHGLTQVRGRQHVDHHTAIEHVKPHCNSWEFFNGIYDDQARGVFTGRIVVHPGAQRTDSKQTSNSLLLSEKARADSQPQLEIYADDVKCTHGVTLGPIDEKSLFYLRSRGMTESEARDLLTYGFGAEILGKIKLPELRERLDDMIKTRLKAGSTWRPVEA